MTAVAVEDADRPRHVRLPSDLLRLLVAVAIGCIGLLVAGALDDLSAGLTVEVLGFADAAPDPVVVVGILAVQTVAWLVPSFAVAALVWNRTYRRLALAALATALAVVVAW
ncbi:MAG: hypothetical protein ACR2O6_14815, partial [Ilumatobacteraceae bacterium]